MEGSNRSLNDSLVGHIIRVSVEIDSSLHSEKRRVSDKIEPEKAAQKNKTDNTPKESGAPGSIPLHAMGYYPAYSPNRNPMDATGGTS